MESITWRLPRHFVPRALKDDIHPPEEVLLGCNDELIRGSLDVCISKMRPGQVLDLQKEWAGGVALLKARRFQDARDAFRRVCKKAPKNADAWMQLGAVQEQLGEHANALSSYSRAVKADGANIQALIRYGHMQAFAGLLEKAKQTFRKILALHPAFVDAKLALALVYKQQQQFPEALQLLEECAEGNPDNAQALFHLADCHREMNNYKQAIPVYKDGISKNARYIPAWTNLAACYVGERDLESAASVYRELAGKTRLGIPETCNYASILGRVGRLSEAQSLLERIKGVAQENLTYLLVLGKTQACQGLFELAATSFKQAKELDPKGYWAYVIAEVKDCQFSDTVIVDMNARRSFNYYCMDRWGRGDWNEFENLHGKVLESLDDWLSDTDAGLESLPLFPGSCTKLDMGSERQVGLARKFGGCIQEQMNDRYGSSPFVYKEVNTAANNRIKIGYLSADFGSHSVGILLRGLFGLHDRERFEVFAYSLKQRKDDDIKKQIVGSCDHFVDCAKMDNFSSAKKIHADKIDILVDLGGYTRGHRKEILALRPAPVQVHYFGFPGPICAKAVDYRIADPVLMPPGSDMDFDEKIVRITHGHNFVTGYADVVPETTRAEHDLPAEAVVYCCFNQLDRIDPGLYSAWLEVLREVPESVLWLKKGGNDICENLLAEAERQGVSRERIIFAPFLSLKNHLARVGLADLFLDTRIYSAFTTLTMVLWQGLPVLTINGETWVSRLGASAIADVGLSELAVQDLGSYKDMAIKIGMDAEYRQRIRSSLDDVRNKTLFDTKDTAMKLDKAYAMMMQRYLSGESPESFDITL